MALSSSKSCPHCGDNHKGKPFALYNDGYHCFSCGTSKRAIRNFRTTQLKTSHGIEMPELTRNPSMFSLPVLKWLKQYHVTDELIYKYNIAEALDNSVITPVLQNDKVVMYQRRWLDPRRIMTYGNKKPFIASSSKCDTLVIVEDFISAIRVGEVVDCYCMFGTSLSYEILKKLVSEYAIIVIWADGDIPGQRAAAKLLDTLNRIISNRSRYRAFSPSTNNIIYNIVTEKDPKLYTNSEIHNYIRGNNEKTSKHID